MRAVMSHHSLSKLNAIDIFVIAFFVWGYGRITTEIYRPLLMLIGIVPVILILVLKKRVHKLDISELLYAIFLFLFLIFIPISDESGTAISYFGAYTMYFFPYIFFKYYEKNIRSLQSLQRLYKIVITICCYLFLIGIASIIVYTVHPGIARLYATHRSDLMGLMIGGGYQLAYVGSLLLPFLVHRAFQKKQVIFTCAVIFLIIILLWKTGSMLTLLSGIIGMVMQFWLRGNSKRRLYMSLCIILGFVILFALRNNIGEFLIDISNGKVVTDYSTMNNTVFVRLNEIGWLLKGNVYSDLVATNLRYENFVRPFTAICEHPFTGALFITGVNPEQAIYNDSSIITAISCWGVPMALLYFYPFFSVMKKYRRFLGCGTVAFLLVLLNPTEGVSLFSTCYFLLPALAILEEEGVI